MCWYLLDTWYVLLSGLEVGKSFVSEHHRKFHTIILSWRSKKGPQFWGTQSRGKRGYSIFGEDVKSLRKKSMSNHSDLALTYLLPTSYLFTYLPTFIPIRLLLSYLCTKCTFLIVAYLCDLTSKWRPRDLNPGMRIAEYTLHFLPTLSTTLEWALEVRL